MTPLSDSEAATVARFENAEPAPESWGGGLRAEDVARRFHETYERLAPSFGYETRRESAVPWQDVPEQNQRLMVAVCEEVTAALRAKADAADRVRELAEKWMHDPARSWNPAYGEDVIRALTGEWPC